MRYLRRSRPHRARRWRFDTSRYRERKVAYGNRTVNNNPESGRPILPDRVDNAARLIQFEMRIITLQCEMECTWRSCRIERAGDDTDKVQPSLLWRRLAEISKSDNTAVIRRLHNGNGEIVVKDGAQGIIGWQDRVIVEDSTGKHATTHEKLHIMRVVAVPEVQNVLQRPRRHNDLVRDQEPTAAGEPKRHLAQQRMIGAQDRPQRQAEAPRHPLVHATPGRARLSLPHHHTHHGRDRSPMPAGGAARRNVRGAELHPSTPRSVKSDAVATRQSTAVGEKGSSRKPR